MKQDKFDGMAFIVIGTLVIIAFSIWMAEDYLENKVHFDEVCRDNNFTKATDWSFGDHNTNIQVECDDEHRFRVWKNRDWEVDKWGEIEQTGEYKYLHWDKEWR